MTDLEKISVTAASALIVYVIGQLMSKFFIDPVHDLRQVIVEVRSNLSFHSPTIHTPIGRTKANSDKAREALMKNSSELVAKLHAIPLYGVVRSLSFGILPHKKAIEDAAVQLRGLCTHVHEEGPEALDSLGVISKHVAKIEKLLGLKTPEQ